MSRITPAQENARMLAHLLGVSEDQAAAQLEARVRIRYAPGRADFARELREHLSRTIQVVDDDPCDLEVAIDIETRGANTIFVGIAEDAVSIGTSPTILPTTAAALHPLQLTIASCFAAGAILRRVLRGLPHLKPADPFVVRFSALGATRRTLELPIALDDTVLVGAGAIGNGFLRACRGLQVHGTLTVCDPKLVGEGNPNRCLYFDGDDVGQPKAERLCMRAQPDFPGLALTAVNDELASIVTQRRRVRRVIVAVDSRRARRLLQNQLPLEVIDASTTDASEIVVHSHRQPTDGACLGCIYPHIPDELARERDIAAGLGVELDDVASGRLIDERVGRRILAQHPALNVDAQSLVGVAFDSLFKQLCAEQTLLTPQGAQVLAPFAFVSNLAGALLALELARFEASALSTNYMVLSPWAPPHTLTRSWQKRDPECHFCGRDGSQQAMKLIWPEHYQSLAR